jgi:hypothetical protein
MDFDPSVALAPGLGGELDNRSHWQCFERRIPNMMKDVEYHRHADGFRSAERVGDCVAALVVLDHEPCPDPWVEFFAILDEATETLPLILIDTAQVDDDFMAIIDSERVENRGMVLEFFDAVVNHFTTG